MCGGFVGDVVDSAVGMFTGTSGGGMGAPAAPNYQPIADASNESARLARESAQEDLAFRKQVYAESQPRQQQLYELATRVANQQLGITDETNARARDQWQEYDQTYRPLERKMAQEAMDYDSPDRRERLRGEAIQDVATGVDAAAGANRRSMMRMGVNPASGRFAGQDRMLRLAGAASMAGAGNTAVRGLEDRGIALRAGAASFGRNMPNTAGQSFGLSTQAGSSAVANQGAGFAAGLPYAQFQAGGYGTQMGAAGLGLQGALGMGGLMSRDYGTQADVYKTKLNFLGDAAGAAAGLYMFSDRRLKSGIVLVGKHKKGFGIYEYTLFGKRERGVMADEVEKVLPSAVMTHPSGYKMVNYGEL